MDMRSKQWGFYAALAGMGLFVGGHNLRADTVDLPAYQNAGIFGTTSDASNSLADPGMYVGTDSQGNPKRGLIEFNIAGNVPAGATITGVQLDLTVGSTAGSSGSGITPLSNSVTIGLFDVPQAWGQTTNIMGATSFSGNGHGAAAANGDATWNDAFYSSTSPTAWTTAGGDWTAGSTDLANASGTGAVTLMTWSSSLMVADVQNWLNTPSDNNGWLLKNSNETTTKDYLAFWSAQGATAYNNANPNSPVAAPELVVTYTPVPEPSTVLLLACAAPMLLARRSRRAKEQVA
jgi:hypothetical protein